MSDLSTIAIVYRAAMLEEGRFFSVADAIAEQFQSGMLPISSGPAGAALYDWLKGADERISETERRGLYARAFGLAGGGETAAANREFADLWLRLLAALTGLECEVASAAQRLTENLARHAAKVGPGPAKALHALIREAHAVLASPAVLEACEARDPWALVTRVAAKALGETVDGARHGEMAQSGAAILEWLLEGKADRERPEKAVRHHAARWLAAAK